MGGTCDNAAMKAGTIVFGGADLALYGAPRFTLRKTPEPAAPAKATHRRVEITVTVDLRAEMPATVWARARALQALLAAGSEALLEMVDENGGVVAWQATPAGNSLPQAIERRSGRVDMSFTAIEPVAEGNYPLGMTIDPMDGSPTLTIARPGDWTQNVRVSRPDERSAYRDEIACTVTFTARTAFADPLAAVPVRAEFLLDEAQRLEKLSGKQVRIVFAGFDRIVQVESFNAKPSPGWEFIDLDAQVRFVTLPGDSEAEVSFTTETIEDPATGETKTVVAGTAKAASKTTAETKVEAIITAYRTTGRRVSRITKKDKWVDGHDTTAAEWLGIEFSIELTEGSAQTRYTLRIETREGADGNQITYSGTASAASLSVLLATVATASAGKHPVELRSSLTVEYATDDTGTLKLLQGSFSHEYQVAATVIRGSVTRGNAQGGFQDWQSSISGSVAASTYTIGRSAARSFIPAGIILRTDDENREDAFAGTDPAALATQLVTLSFSYAWGVPHSKTTVEYEDTESPDYTRMLATREISGTARATNKATAQAAVAEILTGLGLSNPIRATFVSANERQTENSTTTSRWLSFRFSYGFETKLTGTIGHDIIEASFSLQRIGMVDFIPMTEVPLMKPVTQLTGGTMQNPIGFGHTIGRLVAGGSVKARQKATAITWGQAKRTSAERVGSYYGAADAPDERLTESYVPFNGTSVACYQFDFQYPFRYADGLTGLMPGA